MLPHLPRPFFPALPTKQNIRPNPTPTPPAPHPQAAYREALEEAGIGIRLEGILRVEHKLTAPTKGRLRVVYLGAPIHPGAPLKVSNI